MTFNNNKKKSGEHYSVIHSEICVPNTLKRDCSLQGFPKPLTYFQREWLEQLGRKDFQKDEGLYLINWRNRGKKAAGLSRPSSVPHPDEVFDCLPYLNLFARKAASPTSPSTSPPHPLAHISDHGTWHLANWARDTRVPDPGHHSIDWPTVTWPDCNMTWNNQIVTLGTDY